MTLMAEGIEKKQEALIMLNNAYINTRRSWNLRHTFNKVQNHLYKWLLNCEYVCGMHVLLSLLGCLTLVSSSYIYDCCLIHTINDAYCMFILV
uniref:Uncharacterized protein n=1 Tax=Lactuca sativa TaxID=4236 RepID=A0A9R1VB32_LACSA|nr:hypothetical protein LSAT_V11C500242490 [Lactuca sativa]